MLEAFLVTVVAIPNGFAVSMVSVLYFCLFWHIFSCFANWSPMRPFLVNLSKDTFRAQWLIWWQLLLNSKIWFCSDRSEYDFMQHLYATVRAVMESPGLYVALFNVIFSLYFALFIGWIQCGGMGRGTLAKWLECLTCNGWASCLNPNRTSFGTGRCFLEQGILSTLFSTGLFQELARNKIQKA